MWATRNLNSITAGSPFNVAFKGLRCIFIDCMKDPGPRCPKYTTADVPKKEDCRFILRKTDACRPPKNFVSIWQDSDCGRCTRLNQYVRHDDLYLQPTDMKKRTCQQTWLDFPAAQEYPIECTPPHAVNVVEPEKRVMKKERIGECEKSNNILAIRKCRLPADQDCAKIKMKGCRPTLGSSRCTKGRPPTKFKKVCTPYPAYSECDWKKMKEIAYAHCKCFIMPVRCELYENLDKNETINIYKPPKIPEPRTSLT